MEHRTSDVCVDSGVQKVYISCSSADVIHVLDIGPDTLLSTIENIDHPSGLCTSSTDHTVWVCERYQNRIAIIDTDSDSITTTIDIAFSPLDVDIPPGGSTAFISGNGAITGISTDTYDVLGTAYISETGYRIESTLDGSRIYVLCQGGHLLSVDIPSFEVDSICTEFAGPFSLDIDHERNHLYVTTLALEGGLVLQYNTETNTLIDSVFIGGLVPNDIAVINCSDYVYAGVYKGGSGPYDQFSVILRGSNEVINSIDLDHRATRIASTENGNVLYVATNSDYIMVLER